MFGNSKWLRGLRSKLLLLLALPILMMSVLGGMSLYQTAELKSDVENLGTQRLPLTEIYGEMRTSMQGMPRYLWVAFSQGEDHDKRAAALQEVEQQRENFELAMAKFSDFKVNEKTAKAFSPVPPAWKEYSTYVGNAVKLLSKNDAGVDQEVKYAMTEKFLPVAKVIIDALHEVNEASAEVNSTVVQNAQDHANQARTVIWFTILAGSLLLLLLGMPLAAKVSSRLDRIAANLGDSGEQVTSASAQLSSASQQLSSGATQAAASLEETVSSLEELTAMVKQNSDNASEAAGLSSSSRGSAETGEAEIRRLISAMSEISGSSKKIEEIINVIDDIAFQTNLLALNAAVEAARAGEQGRGFAVVAEAVRNLAHRSAAAAKDINSLIKDSVAKSENGAKIANQSGIVFKEIVTSVKKVADLNSEIASASREQSAGLAQINKALNEMDQVSQSNAASAEEVAASAEEMSSQASSLQDMVIELNQLVSGSVAAQAPVPSAAHQPAGKKGLPRKGVAAAAPSRPAPPKPASSAKEAIPFDDDQTLAKVGTTDGF